ncbi:MAG: SpoIID/LytB domain-containing protein [Anaerovoracaceae bacterium]|jgi:stage II sporulation protein D
MKSFVKVLGITGLFFLAVLLFPQGERAFGADGNDYIKVGLKYGVGGVTQCKMTAAEGFVIGTATRSGFKEERDLSEHKTLVASLDCGIISLLDSEGEAVVTGLKKDQCLMSAGEEDIGIISCDGKPYRGGLMFHEYNELMTVINFLSVDRYVCGVLHRELSQSSPLESLKAQAVAARSFAVKNFDRHKEWGFDVCCTTHCQVYGGYGDEYPKTNKAVEETAGQILWHKGKPVVAFYSKNSGGYTQNSEDVWNEAMGHLRGIRDDHSPRYSWTATIAYDSLKQKLEEAGFYPGEILSVSVGGRNAMGSISELIIKGGADTICLKKESIRSVLGSALIKSRNFVLAQDGGEGMQQPYRISIKGMKDSSLCDEKIVALGHGGVKRAVSVEDVHVFNGDTVKKVTPARLEIGEREWGDYDPVNPVDGAAVFSGLGYGHGVGMSQDGVIAMGKKGYDYMQILHYYFNDIEVR